MKQFAMVFPGQGSQSLGMLSTLAIKYSLVEKTFCEASEVLGYDLWALVQSGPAEELIKTWQTQPAVLAASVAIFHVWNQKNGATPRLMSGHSLGEYSALVCAGVIDFKAAIKLVELRGKLMQEAIPDGTGAMYVIIGLDNKSVEQACNEASQGEVVSSGNFNAPEQIVITGEKTAVERAGIICKNAGAKRVLPLSVNIASHCALMKPAAEKLAIILKAITFNKPNFPVINNVDVQIEEAAENIRDALVRQLYNPVRWTEIIKLIASQGIEYIVEIGPGTVLTGLSRRIVKNLTAVSTNNPLALCAALKKPEDNNEL
ncbi:Malonyl CoA-acyl carrier protein transacylase [Candidatus Hartigia pinicola]|nr:Malonyl CoA-acyl carrier protein transacylase [Candidatus Hartigia pinicola]